MIRLVRSVVGQYYCRKYSLPYHILGFILPQTLVSPAVIKQDNNKDVPDILKSLYDPTKHILYFYDLVDNKIIDIKLDNAEIRYCRLLDKTPILQNKDLSQFCLKSRICDESLFRLRVAKLLSSQSKDSFSGLIENNLVMPKLISPPLYFSQEYLLNNLHQEDNLLPQDKRFIDFCCRRFEQINNEKFILSEILNQANQVINKSSDTFILELDKISSKFNTEFLKGNLREISDFPAEGSDISLKFPLGAADSIGNLKFPRETRDKSENNQKINYDNMDVSYCCNMIIVNRKKTPLSIPYTFKNNNDENTQSNINTPRKILIPCKRATSILNQLTREQKLELLIYLDTIEDTRFDSVKMELLAGSV